MTNEELNAHLYLKMAREFEAYGEGLMGLPGEEILTNAYEYSTKEDILYSLRENDLSDKQCKILLKLEKPLDAIFQHYEKHGKSRMPDLLSAVEEKANAMLRDEFLKRQQAR